MQDHMTFVSWVAGAPLFKMASFQSYPCVPQKNTAACVRLS